LPLIDVLLIEVQGLSGWQVTAKLSEVEKLPLGDTCFKLNKNRE